MSFLNETKNNLQVITSTVSKQCWDVMYQDKFNINQRPIPVIDDIHNKVHELYPTFSDTDYTLYWRYSKEQFLKIYDFASYFTALTLIPDGSLYLLLNDGDEHCEETETFLKMIDLQELKEEKERNRDKYDVRIKPEDYEEEDEEIVEEEPPAEGETCDDDSKILTYALRKLPEVEPFTADLLQKANLIRDVKKGIYIL